MTFDDLLEKTKALFRLSIAGIMEIKPADLAVSMDLQSMVTHYLTIVMLGGDNTNLETTVDHVCRTFGPLSRGPLDREQVKEEVAVIYKSFYAHIKVYRKMIEMNQEGVPPAETWKYVFANTEMTPEYAAEASKLGAMD
jgi:hypothetical protein